MFTFTCCVYLSKLTLWIVLGLRDKFCGAFTFLPTKTSVCVAWVFIAFLFCFSIECISKDCWFIGCIKCGCERVCCNCGLCKIVCICIVARWWGGGCWVIVIVGFFPPINLSWLRAFNIWFPCLIPIASSNDASVRDRAKLTCFVLNWGNRENNSLRFNRNVFDKLL
jgi:hypothetical protein